MKQKIFIYLFVFSVLLILFQYVNSKRVFEDMDKTLRNYKSLSQKYRDSVVALQNDMAELSHFNFRKNEDAITYFEKEGFKADELELFVKDNLQELNFYKGEEHPVIPYASSEGRRMLINTIKLLNHKWIVADFSDGQYWGEIFLKYYINEDKTVDFELVESFLYPFD